MLKILHLAAVLVIFTNIVIAQSPAGKQKPMKKNNLIQFSGVVVEGDSLRPVPYTSIIVKNSYHGTISDYFGYFSFVAATNDTIEFSAIGFNTSYYVIPDTLSSYTYSLIQVLRKDTIYLKTTEVYPWPSKEQFKQAFLNLNLPDDDLARAGKNMDRAVIKDQMVGMAMDASLNYKYSNQQYQSRLYYAGQYPPNNLLNPIAWAKFIKAWKNGDLKKK
ncbi:MAG: carboxypeptidase-like regulatory domain-containing protein [Bacteroidota bacterium]